MRKNFLKKLNFENKSFKTKNACKITQHAAFVKHLN